LNRVDTDTGLSLATLAVAPDASGLTYAGNGIIYAMESFGAGAGKLWKYTIGTDTWTLVGDSGVAFIFAGLAHDPGTNTLYAIGDQDRNLYSLNPTTALATLVGDTGLGSMTSGGLAFVQGVNGTVGASTDEDTPSDVSVLSNDIEVDGETLRVSAFDALSAFGATITLNGNGTLHYDPTAAIPIQLLDNGDTLIDTFDYTVTDDADGTSTATVTMTVTGISGDGDLIKPTVTLTSAASVITNLSPFQITVTFDEDIASFASTDLVLSNATASNYNTVTANQIFTFDITAVAEGAITVAINADQVVDLSGNGNVAATDFTINYEMTAPTVTITSDESDPTANTVFQITVVFSEDVLNFSIADLTVTNGEASNTVTVVADSVFAFDIIAINTGGVSVELKAGQVTDLAGNGNIASNLYSINFESADLQLSALSDPSLLDLIGGGLSRVSSEFSID